MTKRPNKYAGKCEHCGATVEVGAGVISKRDGKWVVEHDGDCPDGDAAPAPVAMMKPTEEQEACVALYATGASMVIEAGAGTGKTSTLRLLAMSNLDRSILYLAYNTAIVKDVAGSMPRNVEARTAHSLAYRAIGAATLRPRLEKPRQRREEIARVLGIDAPLVFKMADGAPPKALSPGQLAGYVMRGLARFCSTADAKPNRRHFEHLDLIDPPVDGHRTAVNNAALAAEMEPALERAWADVNRPDGWLRYSHDYYLKLWQLTHPKLDVDVVMLDEAQDADPVIAAIVEEQTHAQRIYVGDENQEIYAWRGAVNAMAKFETENRRMLTKSFRFGPAIADVANEVLSKLAKPTKMRIRGHEPIGSTVGELAPEETDAILCRTNAQALTELMDALARNERPHLVGGGKDMASFARGALDLQRGRGTDHAELSAFDSWNQVVEFVKQDDGEDLALMVKLVEQFGAEALLDAIDGMAEERNADLVISTAHKAKGREWARVRLAKDFGPKDPNNPPDDAELRLRYVACTRARQHLDHTALSKPRCAPGAPGGETGPAAAGTSEKGCVDCGSTRLVSGYYDAELVAVNGEAPGASWATVCSSCGAEQ